jgi:hypothetical protein
VAMPSMLVCSRIRCHRLSMGVWGVTGIRDIALPPQELHRPMTTCAADSRSVRRLELRNLPNDRLRKRERPAGELVIRHLQGLDVRLSVGHVRLLLGRDDQR